MPNKGICIIPKKQTEFNSFINSRRIWSKVPRKNAAKRGINQGTKSKYTRSLILIPQMYPHI